MSLCHYARKRRFDGTPEPAGASDAAVSDRPIFVVQLHHASSRHYDFRLEMDGVLKSWAVPKGPSLRPGDKRLAVEVEDHPLEYATFAGDIPKGHYGAGHVEVFDHGHWAADGDPLASWAAGTIDFSLSGDKLRGAWKLIRTRQRGRQRQWLLIKRTDDYARDCEADDLVDTEQRQRRTKKAAAGTRKAPSKRSRPGDWRQRALALDSAVERPAVGFEPPLATLRSAPPAGDQWLHEIKWDGYRLLVDLVDGSARLRSRGGQDWTETFAEVARAVESLGVDQVCLDGELVVLDEHLVSDFSGLLRVIEGSSRAPLTYMIFDLAGVAGVDLRAAPLTARKALLKDLLAGAPALLKFSDHVAGYGAEVFAQTREQGIEGVVSKRADSPYRAGRGDDWIKAKHAATGDFIVVGFTEPQGSRGGFGALLLAAWEHGALRYVGRVGTGFDAVQLRAIHRQLKPLQQKQSSVALPGHVRVPAGSVHWVAPEVVIEVAFRGWAKEGLLRQASFQRLRADKTPAAMRREGSDAVSPKSSNDGDNSDTHATAAITHADRVVFADAPYTKGDVAAYYRDVARWMLPELRNRPLSLLRCPQGSQHACFFQKHPTEALGEQVKTVRLDQHDGPADYLYVQSIEGVVELVQMGTIELHPWGARIEDPEHADRLVFDLDPGPGVGWEAIVEAARDVRDKLKLAGLASFVRLSGGKGLHVVVPLRPAASWEDARAFCEGFAQAMAAHQPQIYVATMAKARRRGKIFIDWLRNTRGSTSVASWSLRARAGGYVAVPLRWSELGGVEGPGAYDLEQARLRATRLRSDPWGEFARLRQPLPDMASGAE